MCVDEQLQHLDPQNQCINWFGCRLTLLFWVGWPPSGLRPIWVTRSKLVADGDYAKELPHWDLLSQVRLRPSGSLARCVPTPSATREWVGASLEALTWRQDWNWHGLGAFSPLIHASSAVVLGRLAPPGLRPSGSASPRWSPMATTRDRRCCFGSAGRLPGFAPSGSHARSWSPMATTQKRAKQTRTGRHA